MKKISSLLVMLIIFSINTSAQFYTIELQPGPEGKDAELWSINPDQNYGNSEKFVAMVWTFSNVYGIDIPIIDFDLSEIPSGAEILDARLNLYYYSNEPNYTPHTGDNAAYLSAIVSEWNEEEVTWNQMPEITAENQVYLPQSVDPEQDYTDIDVTSLIRTQFENPDQYFGLMLHLITDTPYASLMFASGDNEDPELRPKLVITYQGCTLPTSNFTYVSTDSSFSFTDLSSPSDTWYWDFGDGYYSTLQNPEHVYEAFDTYLVCLTVTDSCGSNTYCDTVNYCQSPYAEFSTEIDNKTVIFQNLSNNGDSYYWDFGDGYLSDLENPTHTYNDYGLYEVCLSVINECDSSEVCDTVEIINSGVFENPVHHKVNVYPNPLISTTTISYELKHPEMISFTIFNSLGQIVYRKQENQSAGKQQIFCDLSNLSDGIYYYRLKAEDDIVNGKIVKTK